MSKIEGSESRQGLKTALINGGAAGNHAVTGITMAGALASVLRLPAVGGPSAITNLTAEFSISAADQINNAGGTDTTGDKLLVLYHDAN